MRKSLIAFAILVTFGLGAGPVSAQVGRQGTPEDQRACNLDVRQHCREVMTQGDMVVLACLQQHRAKLTRACEAVLRKNGQ